MNDATLRWAAVTVCTALCLTALACATAGRDKAAFAGGKRIDFQGANGRLAIRIEPRGESIRFESGKGELIATVRPGEEQLLVEDAVGHTVGIVRPIEHERRRFRVLDPSDGRTSYELRRDPDGDWKAYGPSGERIAVAKRRDYGFKLVSADGETAGKVRSRSGKISLRDASGTTYLETRDPIPVDAAAVLALEALPFEVAAGLAVAVIQWPPEREAAEGSGA